MKSYACLLRRGTHLCMIINKILFILVMIDLVAFDESQKLKIIFYSSWSTINIFLIFFTYFYITHGTTHGKDWCIFIKKNETIKYLFNLSNLLGRFVDKCNLINYNQEFCK